MTISRLFERTRSLIRIIVFFFFGWFYDLSATCGDSGVTNHYFTLVRHIQPNLEWDLLWGKLTNWWNKLKRKTSQFHYICHFLFEFCHPLQRKQKKFWFISLQICKERCRASQISNALNNLESVTHISHDKIIFLFICNKRRRTSINLLNFQ